MTASPWRSSRNLVLGIATAFTLLLGHDTASANAPRVVLVLHTYGHEAAFRAAFDAGLVALNLHPDRRRIVVIDGALGNPGNVQQEVESQLKGVEQQASLTYLRDPPLKAVRERGH